MRVILVLLYPVLLHLSFLIGRPHLQVFAIIALALGILWANLRRAEVSAWILLLAISLAAIALGLSNLTLYVLYLPPIVLPLLMLFVFGRTLMPGREPLVTAIGEATRGPLSAAMRHYTRRVTQCWTGVLALMLAWSVILAAIDEPALWSWFTNFINYAIVIVLFIAEFCLRRQLFPDHDHPGFAEYLRIVRRAGIRP